MTFRCASEGANVAVSIDRVAEAGVGTASRSALWILDETKTKYVLFADVRGEGNWHYNRKIGEAGDSPTGSGPNIAAFDGATFNDGGLHRMSIVADGKTVKLSLDGQFGQEVKFPFSPVVFEADWLRAINWLWLSFRGRVCSCKRTSLRQPLTAQNG